MYIVSSQQTLEPSVLFQPNSRQVSVSKSMSSYKFYESWQTERGGNLIEWKVSKVTPLLGIRESMEETSVRIRSSLVPLLTEQLACMSEQEFLWEAETEISLLQANRGWNQGCQTGNVTNTFVKIQKSSAVRGWLFSHLKLWSCSCHNRTERLTGKNSVKN